MKTLLNIFLTVKRNGQMCEHLKIFQQFSILRYSMFHEYSKIKKNVVYSKPFIQIIGILLLIVRFVKSLDYSDHKKKQINFNIFN